MLSRTITTILLIAASTPGFQSAKAPEARTDVPRPQLSTEQWRADLNYFASEMAKRHLNAFHYVSRERFDKEVAGLDQKLAQLNANGVYVGLQRLASLIGDGHTSVRLPNELVRNFPILLRSFEGVYRVVAVAPGLETALGMRIIKIQETPIAKAVELLQALTPQDEPLLAPVRIPGFLTFANMLHGLGIISNQETARYTVADDSGREFSIDTHALSNEEFGKIDFIRVMKQPPLSLQKLQETLWFTFLPESKTVYCQFRSYDQLEKRGKELMEFVKQKQPDKLVIDLRRNQGGDYFRGLYAIVHPIRDNPAINKKGHLFVIIGPATFSAAMSNATHFHYQTAAILVGEPIGEKPNSYAEPRNATLPNSHFIFRYQTKYYKFVDSGENLVRPDQEILTKWEDYKAGRDAALEWILKYEAK